MAKAGVTIRFKKSIYQTSAPDDKSKSSGGGGWFSGWFGSKTTSTSADGEKSPQEGLLYDKQAML